MDVLDVLDVLKYILLVLALSLVRGWSPRTHDSLKEQQQLAQTDDPHPHTHNPRQLVEYLNFPHVFIIGSMKCGTTTLHHMLTDNPHICGEGEKEKHFYDKNSYVLGYDKAKNAYLNEFSDCKPNQLTIDASPDYISTPVVPERIQESYPPGALASKRFILILREPVSRQYSEYQMRLRVCESQFDPKFVQKKMKETTSEEEKEYRQGRFMRNCKHVTYNFFPGVEFESVRFMTFFQYVHSPYGLKEVARGHFRQHITRWLKFVRREQLFIVNFATLVRNTTMVYNAMMQFMGLPDDVKTHIDLPQPRYKGTNHTYDKFAYLDCGSHARLSHYFAKVNTDLVSFINNGSGSRSPFEPDFVPFEPVKCVRPGGDDRDADDFMVQDADDEEKSDD